MNTLNSETQLPRGRVATAPTNVMTTRGKSVKELYHTIKNQYSYYNLAVMRKLVTP